MDEKVVGSGVLGRNKDRVSLGSRDGERLDNCPLDVDSIDLDYVHVVSVDVDVEHGEGRHVDDAETIDLAGHKREFVVQHLIDQCRLGDRLSTGRVEDRQVVIQ